MRIYTTHFVVEMAISTGLRISHMIAEQPLAAADFAPSNDYIDNGYFLKLDIDGKLKTPGSIEGPYYFHYTEELLDDRNLLSDFTVPFEANGNAYPRAVALYTGDVFVTNNYVIDGSSTAQDAAVAIVNNATGQLLLLTDVPASMATTDAAAAGAYDGPLFNVIPMSVPDGGTGFEFLYVKDVSISA